MDLSLSVRILCHQILRRLQWMSQRKEFATEYCRNEQEFPKLLFRHTSVLIRDPARAEADLQYGKITNLRLAAAALDRLLVPSQKLLAFWPCIGNPTRAKGYQPGLELCKGKLMASIGGGLCQLTNLLYWMALHLDLEIVERHRHSYDLFPDKDRKIPFAVGATVFYNYRDLQIRNTLAQPIMLRLGIDAEELWGEFWGKDALDFCAHIYERDHRFFRQGNQTFRENRVWRTILDVNGALLRDEEVAHNVCKVLYPVVMDQMQDVGVCAEE
jgi:vancomycin resistance protein VanW